MSEKGDLAKQYFLQGYNCTQAVVLAFEEELSLSRDELLKAALPFGGGLGRQRLVCGTVSGMCMLAGLLYGYAQPGKGKSEVYKIEQELCATFRERHGSLICMELLKGITSDCSPRAEERTPEYYRKRPCPDLAKEAAEIFEAYWKAHPVEAFRERIEGK